MVYAELECLLEKCTHVKIILKNFIQKKKRKKKQTKHTPSGSTESEIIVITLENLEELLIESAI